MKKLTLEEANGLSWGDVVRHFKPDATDDEVMFILYEQTCFPFSTEQTIIQLNEHFNAE